MIKAILLYIWQLPQNIIGFLLVQLLPVAWVDEIDDVNVYKTSMLFGVSLGNYILTWSLSHQAVMHEYGHSRQSKLLGPLYLLFIGLPSLTMNILSRLAVISPLLYYQRWPESWADELGGVPRERR
jgi:hypothetical protein